MARIRSLKPEFWSDVKMVRLSFAARLFYQGLWTFAMCDHGHVVDDVEQLKMNIFPKDDVDAVALLDELFAIDRVVRVMASDGTTYLHVRKLAKHSNTDKRWSTRCAACSCELAETPVDSQGLVGAPTGSQGLTRTHPVKEGKGREGKTPSSTAARSTGDDDPDFRKFWDVYPRKVGKAAARKAWSKAMDRGVTPLDVIAGAERYRDDPNRRRRGLEYTKHPGPWLNDERWSDDLASGDLTAPPNSNFWES